MKKASHQPSIKVNLFPRVPHAGPIERSRQPENRSSSWESEVIDNRTEATAQSADIAQFDPLRTSPYFSYVIGKRSEDPYVCRSLRPEGMRRRLNMSSAGGCKFFNGSIEISATTWLSVLVRPNRLTSPSRLLLSMVSNIPSPSRLSLSMASNIPS